ncbi:MAG: protein kinase [Vicinamibacteria bacterium]|nr:protein kinase [Vicinamibacteria bacterium]
MSESTPSSDLSEIAGRYQVVTKLGAGAFGTVFKARDKVLGRMVAIKTIRLDGLAAAGVSREELMDRFGREARIAAQIKHPNIVTIYDVGETGGVNYLAMEYIDGIGLDKLIVSSGPLPAERAGAIAAQVADALDHAHRHHVVHRDIKPANVMIEAGDHVKVTDFGIAKPLDASEKLTITGSLLGTPSYISPEQARGGAIDGRSDLFALGCILYEMLSGKRAFTGESITGLIFKIITEEPPPLRSLAPTVPEAMARIVDRALAKVPGKRYQSGQEMARDLSALTGPAAVPTVRHADVPTASLPQETVRSLPQKAPSSPDVPTRVVSPTRAETSPGVRPIPSSPRRSIWLVLALLGVVGLILVAGAAGVAWHVMRPKPRPIVAPGDSTTIDALPPETSTAESVADESTTEIPQSPLGTDASLTGGGTGMASAHHPRTMASVSSRLDGREKPPPAAAPQTLMPEPAARASAIPPESDYSLLDPLPDEEADGSETGHRLAGMYRRDVGSSHGTHQPMRVRRRVPIGAPAERPALRMMHHIINAEESHKSETGKYVDLPALARAGKLTPAVTQTLGKWSENYYRFEIRVEDGGFRLLAIPMMRRETRPFVADDSGIIQPSR